eukprot:317013-Chlamydomonas_euryale.AAC.1
MDPGEPRKEGAHPRPGRTSPTHTLPNALPHFRAPHLRASHVSSPSVSRMFSSTSTFENLRPFITLCIVCRGMGGSVKGVGVLGSVGRQLEALPHGLHRLQLHGRGCGKGGGVLRKRGGPHKGNGGGLGVAASNAPSIPSIPACTFHTRVSHSTTKTTGPGGINSTRKEARPQQDDLGVSHGQPCPHLQAAAERRHHGVHRLSVGQLGPPTAARQHACAFGAAPTVVQRGQCERVQYGAEERYSVAGRSSETVQCGGAGTH